MRRRTLPDFAETARILSEKRSKPARRPPPPAGAVVARQLKVLDGKFAGPAGSGVAPLVARWREVAGELLARRTEPMRLIRPRGGGPATLEVKVDGPTAALVQHQAPDLLERANLVMGAGAIGKLRIVQGPVKPPPSVDAGPAAVAKARRRPPPLDAASEAELEAGLAHAPEGPLKAALLRLGRAVKRAE